MTNLKTALVLMILTIALLSIFQLYWLNKLYDEEYSNVKRTTNVIFKDCLYNLQVDQFKKDTTLPGLPGRPNLFTVDMVNIMRSETFDSTHLSGIHNGKIVISINNHVDSLTKDFPADKDSMPSNIMIRKGGDHDFQETFKSKAKFFDSLPQSVIDSAYSKSLADAKIEIPFKIKKLNLRKDSTYCDGAYCSEIIPMGIFGNIGYQASFQKPSIRLIKSIGPQILLSVFLLGLTMLSFLFIYRNLMQQKKLADIKDEFISNITHELKTPLATVSVAIEAIKNFSVSEDPFKTQEYLGMAEIEVQRLNILIDKVLKLSMFEQQQVNLKLENLDLSLLTEEVLNSMRLQFDKNKAIISKDLGGGYFINADRMHITSVLFNLLDNALKYCKSDPFIDIRISKKEGMIMLSVSDTGIGIASEFRSKIFEKFFRVPHGNAHDAKGYGLGLSYVTHILKEHHGTILVNSELGKGSTFTIKIPEA